MDKIVRTLTIKKPIMIKNIGLHFGKKVIMRMLPAYENTGIIFKRVDLRENNIIPARYDLVQGTTLCTKVVNSSGVSVSTIEHLMCALAYFKIDNLIIEINAPEVPILDGSADLIIKKINKVGLCRQSTIKKVLKVIKPVKVKTDQWSVEIVPNKKTIFNVTIDFENKVIGKSTKRFILGVDNFEKEIARARTFCLYQDIKYLHANNLALGGSLENAVVVDKDCILNKEGLRYKDEFVRHKILDAIGDLYLGGYLIKGEFIGYKCGHAANNMLLREIFKDSKNYVIENEYDVICESNKKESVFVFSN